MQATVYNLTGAAVDTVDLDDAIFGIVPNTAVVHQAVLRQQANARLGTHDTKTRAEVSGGGIKPWRQKGTGHARQGSRRAPQWRHGGVVFGPHPRSYAQPMPRQMRRLAMRSVLSDKVAGGGLLIVDSFADLEPRTKAMLVVLADLQLSGRRVLIMTPEKEENLERAAGNVPNVETMMAQYLSLVAMLKADVVVLSRASLAVIQGILGNTGGRRPRAIQLTEAELEHIAAQAPTPIGLPVQQLAGASAVTADSVAALPEDAVAEAGAADAADDDLGEDDDAADDAVFGEDDETADEEDAADKVADDVDLGADDEIADAEAADADDAATEDAADEAEATRP